MEEMDDLLNQPLAKITLVYFDVETTGLNPRFGDRICEVAALRCRGGEELLAYHTLVNPQRPISPGAYRVNRITEEELASAPLFEDVADRLLEVLSSGVMVAHNAPFDLGFLSAELAMLGYPMPEVTAVDTLALARRCYSFPSNSLRNVSRSLGLAAEQLHRAMSDVQLTRMVLETFLGGLRSQGVLTLGDLLEIQGDLTWRRISGRRRLPGSRGSSGGRRSSGPGDVPLPPLIQEALDHDGDLYIRYVSATGQETERIVRPMGVASRRDYVYLEAYCYLREARRVFRLDRILEMGSRPRTP